jgi:hypothetical protein
MFKTASFFRIASDFVMPPLDAFEEALQAQRFVPCGATQPESHGWVPPRGKKSVMLAESVGGQVILSLCTERRALPASVAFENQKHVAARQSPLAVIFGVAFVLGGLALALGGTVLIAQGVGVNDEGIPYSGNIAAVVFGIVLIAGGVIGLWETIKKFM